MPPNKSNKKSSIKNILTHIDFTNIPKIYLFFFASFICAVSYQFSTAAYFCGSITTILLFFKKPLNVVTAVLFIIVNIISAHFFIAVETDVYKNYLMVKTPSAKLHLDKDIRLQTGDLVVGYFKKDATKSKFFYKPVYVSEKDIKIFKIPLISNILEYRERVSNRMFFASGGKVYTAQALIFADRRFIPETLKDDYNISGLAHLLSMSGTHVGIIVAIFVTALFFIPIKFRMFFAIFGVGLITIFGVFTITVVRAACFAAAFMVCYILDIKIDSKKFLLFMISFFMIFSPLVIIDISFLLSFGAVFGIIYMVKAGRDFITAGLLTGVAATLITAPLAMYVFGMTNHLSVITTLIISPIIYLHILFALLYLIMPTVCLAPLILVEGLSNSSIELFSSLTYFGFILKTIPLWLLLICVIFTIVTLASRYKWLSLIVLLVIFYPPPKPPDIIFPALSGANKGFLSFTGGRSEIFYQGSAGGFKYNFVPTAAKYGIKTFDHGDIRIFNGKNNYIRIKETGKNFTNICLNEKDKDCRFFYHTRSNSVTKKIIDDKTVHIIYKNKIEDKSIYELFKTGDIIIKNGELVIDDKDNH